MEDATLPPTEPASPQPPPPPTPPLLPRLAGWLERRGLGPAWLAGLAVALAALTSLLLLLAHPGLAGFLGLLALFASLLSLALPEATTPRARYARALAPAVDLLVAGGVLAGAAAQGQPDLVVALALLVLLLVAWLPHVEGRAGPGNGDIGLWGRTERVGLLAAAALLGRLVPGLLLVAAMGALDAWAHLEGLRHAGGVARSPFLAPLRAPDGRLLPAVRWGSLALAVLVLLVLPRADDWRI